MSPNLLTSLSGHEAAAIETSHKAQKIHIVKVGANVVLAHNDDCGAQYGYSAFGKGNVNKILRLIFVLKISVVLVVIF